MDNHIKVHACNYPFCPIAEVPSNNATAFWIGVGFGVVAGVAICYAIANASERMR